MKQYIVDELLSRPDVGGLLPETRWEHDILHASGPLGTGTVHVTDFHVTVAIELSPAGALAKTLVENKLIKALSQS